MFSVPHDVASSLISASTLLVVALITFVANRYIQIEASWREEKLRYYREFVESISDIIEGDDTPDGHRKFAKATNNLHLVASPNALAALHQYREHISLKNHETRNKEADMILLAALFSEIRRDLKMARKANVDKAVVRLWASGARRKSPFDSKE